MQRQREMPVGEAGRGRVPCPGRLGTKPLVKLWELSTLLPGRGKLFLLRGFISMLMRLRRWAKLFFLKNSISPFPAL